MYTYYVYLLHATVDSCFFAGTVRILSGKAPKKLRIKVEFQAQHDAPVTSRLTSGSNWTYLYFGNWCQHERLSFEAHPGLVTISCGSIYAFVGTDLLNPPRLDSQTNRFSEVDHPESLQQ